MGSRGKDCDGLGLMDCLPHPQRRFPAPGGIKVHEKWDPRNPADGNDIALIRLNKPVDTFIEDPSKIDWTILAPICLPWDPELSARKLAAKQEVVVAGWGKITNSQTETAENYEDYPAESRYLNKLKLPLDLEENCSRHFRRFDPKTQYCAGGLEG